MKKKFLLTCSLAIVCGSYAGSGSLVPNQADDEQVAGIMDKQLGSITADMDAQQFQKTTLRALDFLIENAVQTLRDQNLDRDAANLGEEWLTFRTSHLGQLDLGDHRPLSEWLEKKYEWLESRLGASLMQISGLTDIKIFNYAIPVVYNPRGSDWDQEEYQKHFVPYMGASVYWISRGVCSAGLSMPAALLCIPSGKLVRKITERVIAPKLSDAIYKQANR